MSRKMLIDGDVGGDENQYDFDLFVIGAGSGGTRASRFSAQYGAKVVFIALIMFYFLFCNIKVFKKKKNTMIMQIYR